MLRPNSGPGDEREGRPQPHWDLEARPGRLVLELGAREAWRRREQPSLPVCVEFKSNLGRLLCLSGPHCPALINDRVRLSQQFSGADSKSPGGWLEFRFLGPLIQELCGQGLALFP